MKRKPIKPVIRTAYQTLLRLHLRSYETYPRSANWATCSGISRSARQLGCDLSEVAAPNVRKLRARYPKGFVTGGGKREEEA